MGRRALSIEEKRARARERIRKRRLKQHLELRRQQSGCAQQCSHQSGVYQVDNANNTAPIARIRTSILHPQETTLYPRNALEEPWGRNNEPTGGTAPRISQATSFIPNPETSAMTHATEDVTTSSSSSSMGLPSRRLLPQSCSPITAPETGFTAAPAVPWHQPEALPPQFYPRVPSSSALACFILALGAQRIHDDPEFVERSSAVYDQVFRHSFSPTCPCSALAEANDSEHAQAFQEIAQYLQISMMVQGVRVDLYVQIEGENRF